VTVIGSLRLILQKTVTVIYSLRLILQKTVTVIGSLRPRLAIFFDFLLIRGLGCFVFSIFEPSYRGGVPVFGISEASHPLFA
ncbi:MAG: hypothetical protein ACTTJ9_10245, partial [Segatella oris]|uniref:hypothetical protein n=1 Tax=Segatella oris TaxID=28135 RepID=UPI003FA26EA9